MKNKLIYGIQQIGVGVRDADEAFKWYATVLGADVLVFEDDNVATYMAKYMGGEPRKKRALLAMNLNGGSGYEIWQYQDREPQAPNPSLRIGDYGINIAQIKTRSVEKVFADLKSKNVTILTDIHPTPDKSRCFYLADPYDNILCIKEYNSWYSKKGGVLGGIFGCSIGVSDIEASRKLYSDVLGYDKVLYDETDTFSGWDGLPSAGGRFRRILLTHQKKRVGGFSPLLGESEIELIQCMDEPRRPLFENRFWGDLGFIHLCFDIRNMKALVEECDEQGFPFQVLSKESFDMGDANGHWGYLEDNDGTLIEFVETHKVPLVKPFNLNINLRKRDPMRPLPRWLINGLAMKRVKF